MDTKAATLLTKLFGNDGRTIPYRPEVAKVTGGICAAILLQQVAYRASNNEYEPFYKFKEPCQHHLYRDGDSWTEELGFSRREFDNAISEIGVKSTAKLPMEEALKWARAYQKPVIYWTNSNRVTFYRIELDILVKVLDQAYKPKSADRTLAKVQSELLQKHESDFTRSEIPIREPESADILPAAPQEDFQKALTVDLVDVTDTEITCPNSRCDEPVALVDLDKSECRCPHCRQPLWVKNILGVADWKPPQKYRTTRRKNETVGDIVPEMPSHLAPFQVNGNKRKLLELWGKNRDVVIDSLEWARNKVAKNEMQPSQAVRNALTAAERKISIMVEPEPPPAQILGYDPNITPEWMK